MRVSVVAKESPEPRPRVWVATLLRRGQIVPNSWLEARSLNPFHSNGRDSHVEIGR